jgi:hypothetical protein
VRRLEIKDQMANEPERVLELSKVLDQMEEEHERILAEATPPAPAPAAAFALRLEVSASNRRDLRKLLELALHELDSVLDAPGTNPGHTGNMSGLLGDYQLQLTLGEPSATPE